MAGATRVVGRADEKASIERLLCFSPYVKEPLNSKVIKRLVPEQRSRYVLFEFRDSYVLSFWTFDVRFTHSHIMAMIHNDHLFTHNSMVSSNFLISNTNQMFVRSSLVSSKYLYLIMNIGLHAVNYFQVTHSKQLKLQVFFFFSSYNV